MPDRRMHRGPHPEDAAAFGLESLNRLARASRDLCWLLSGEYSLEASLKLAGDRYQLTRRQRLAVRRCVCSDEALSRRTANQIGAQRGSALWIDGLNVLTTIEAALAGGVILKARDGCLRDLASIHGNYKHVEETSPSIALVGRTLARLQFGEVVWYLDRPVSNSGRLRARLQEISTEHRWRWVIELVQDPDSLLRKASAVVATADSAILDRCQHWFNLAAEVIREHVQDAWLVDFVTPGTHARVE